MAEDQETGVKRPRRVAALFTAIRQMWMFVGAVILVLLAFEACYRAQGAGRRAIGSITNRSGAPAHPYAGLDWFDEFTQEESRSSALLWRPYVYFRRRPFEGKFINVDSLGRRRTVQASSTSGVDPVLFFGGSTMFGSPQRDAFTLPSRMAARVAALRSGQPPVEVINFGETGYIFTQSVIELEMQLRDGVRPQVVVFYDGINDVVAGVQSGRGGIPQNEQNRAQEFALGRVLLNWKHDAAAEIHASATLAMLGLRRLQLVQALGGRIAAGHSEQLSTDSIAEAVAHAYVETARLVEALADHYGFRPLYVWQPNFHTTPKVLTPYEAHLRQELDAQEFQRTIRDIHRQMPALVGPRMRQLVGDRFVDATSAFDGDTATVFVDVIGHTTETAVDRVAEVMWPAFAQLLASSRPGLAP